MYLFMYYVCIWIMSLSNAGFTGVVIVDVKSDTEYYIRLYVFELVLLIFGCSETCQHSAL